MPEEYQFNYGKPASITVTGGVACAGAQHLLPAYFLSFRAERDLTFKVNSRINIRLGSSMQKAGNLYGATEKNIE